MSVPGVQFTSRIFNHFNEWITRHFNFDFEISLMPHNHKALLAELSHSNQFPWLQNAMRLLKLSTIQIQIQTQILHWIHVLFLSWLLLECDRYRNLIYVINYLVSYFEFVEVAFCHSQMWLHIAIGSWIKLRWVRRRWPCCHFKLIKLYTNERTHRKPFEP